MNKENKKEEKQLKTLSGVVVSDKMKDTIVVSVSRHTKHPKYGKYITTRKKYKVHDKGNLYKDGDKVKIVGCRPISKEKSFRVLEKLN